MMSSSVDYLVKSQPEDLFGVGTSRYQPQPRKKVGILRAGEASRRNQQYCTLCPPAALLLSYFPPALFATTPSPHLPPPLSDLDIVLIHSHVQYVCTNRPK